MGGAFISEKIAILQPDDFGAAKEREGLQGFAKFAQGLQRFAAVADDLVIHPAQFGGPLLVSLAGALFDGELVVATEQRDRGGRFGGGSGHRSVGLHAAFAELFQFGAHVFHVVEQRARDVDRALLLQGEDD